MEHPTDICAMCGQQRAAHPDGWMPGSVKALAHFFRDFLPREITESPHGPGYHLAKINKGELGEISKIREELDELVDANQQGCKIMELVELADLIGAIELYLHSYHEGVQLTDLIKMKDITKRAFENGRR